MNTFDLLGPMRRVVRDGKRMQATNDKMFTKRTSNGVAVHEHHRSPVYRAERRVRASISQPYVLRSIIDVQMYGYGVLSRAWDYSRHTWPVSFVESEPGRAQYQSGVISTPVPVQQITILHEIAHHLTGTADHSQTFIDAYVYLLRMEMGPDIAQKLLDELPS